MKTSVLTMGMMLMVAGTVHADADVQGGNLERLAQALAQGVPGASEFVAKDGERVKWVGVWMPANESCPNGRLGGAAAQALADGGRYAAEHGARLILFTPPTETSAIGRDAEGLAGKVEVRPNDLIGKHCYLVIQR